MLNVFCISFLSSCFKTIFQADTSVMTFEGIQCSGKASIIQKIMVGKLCFSLRVSFMIKYVISHKVTYNLIKVNYT